MHHTIKIVAVELIAPQCVKVSFTTSKHNVVLKKAKKRVVRRAVVQVRVRCDNGLFRVFDSDFRSHHLDPTEFDGIEKTLADVARSAMLDPKQMIKLQDAENKARHDNEEAMLRTAWADFKRGVGQLLSLNVPVKEIELAIGEEVARSIMDS